MNMLLRSALATALLIVAAAPVAAGELHLSMAGGRVTLQAKDVTVREILAEWSRVGQTRIVNSEKLAGGPVTLELNDVPEAQALDTILRSAAGYVMAPRVAGSPGPSLYDRILILASSRAPIVNSSTPAPFTNRPMQQVPPNILPDDDGDFQPTPGPGIMPMGQPGLGQPGLAPGLMPQPIQPQQQQPQGPLTAPRPGMPTAPINNGPNGNAPNSAPVPSPYLGVPPGPTAPTFNPVPPPPQTRPGGPGE